MWKSLFNRHFHATVSNLHFHKVILSQQQSYLRDTFTLRFFCSDSIREEIASQLLSQITVSVRNHFESFSTFNFLSNLNNHFESFSRLKFLPTRLLGLWLHLLWCRCFCRWCRLSSRTKRGKPEPETGNRIRPDPTKLSARLGDP